MQTLRAPIPMLAAMAYVLGPHLHFSDAGGHIVFLNVATGRYFSIPPSWNSSFRAALEDEKPSGQGDIAHQKLLDAGILRAGGQCRTSRQPQLFITPLKSWNAEAKVRTSALLALHVLWRQHRVAVALRRSRFQDLISELAEEGPNSRLLIEADVEHGIHRLRSAFAVADFAISTADKCLIRSIAFLQLLRSTGVDAVLVIGVTAAPFAAHAWVQRGDCVLNDSLDRVRTFSPILVV